jgi:hypothetical protein
MALIGSTNNFKDCMRVRVCKDNEVSVEEQSYSMLLVRNDGSMGKERQKQGTGEASATNNKSKRKEQRQANCKTIKTEESR